MLERKCPISHTTGCSSSSASMSMSRRRIWLLVMLRRRLERPLRSRFQALELKLHWKKACCWSSRSPTCQSWQLGEDEELLLVILWTLSWIGRSLWSSLHRNVVISGPSPCSLANLQVFSQSFWGLASSVRQGVYSAGVSSSLFGDFRRFFQK